MTEFFHAVLLSALPAVGNFAGGAVAEFVATSRSMLSRALHVASGIVLAVVAVELLPAAMSGSAPLWAVVAGLGLGGAFYVLLEWTMDAISGAEAPGAWMIYAAVAVDLFSDGLMIGISSNVSFHLAFVLTVGQLMADAPEGFATIANFKHRGAPRAQRLILSASFVLPCLLGASVGFWLLRGQAESMQLAALAFTAGILLLAAVEDMLKEAHEVAEDTRASAAFFLGGFILFTVVSSLFQG